MSLNTGLTLIFGFASSLSLGQILLLGAVILIGFLVFVKYFNSSLNNIPGYTEVSNAIKNGIPSFLGGSTVSIFSTVGLSSVFSFQLWEMIFLGVIILVGYLLFTRYLKNSFGYDINAIFTWIPGLSSLLPGVSSDTNNDTGSSYSGGSTSDGGTSGTGGTGTTSGGGTTGGTSGGTGSSSGGGTTSGGDTSGGTSGTGTGGTTTGGSTGGTSGTGSTTTDGSGGSTSGTGSGSTTSGGTSGGTTGGASGSGSGSGSTTGSGGSTVSFVDTMFLYRLENDGGYGTTYNALGIKMDTPMVFTSSKFLYKSNEVDGYYLLDKNSPDYDGLFYKINPTTGERVGPCELKYTDISHGGFFEYQSTNPNHANIGTNVAGMTVYMNTSTYSSSTQYFCHNTNAANNGFPVDAYSTDGITFYSVTRPTQAGQQLQINWQDVVYIVGGIAFGKAWQSSANLYRSTSSTTGTGIKYLYIDSTSGTNKYYISDDGRMFTSFNLADGSYGISSMLFVNGQIINANGQTINYGTSKPGVIASTSTKVAGTSYYYPYNGILYTSTDFVKFINPNNSGDVIYYMDSNQVVSASAVTTDNNGVLWTTIGLMSMRVYNPMDFSISYNNASYTLYCNPNILLMSNGVYKNNDPNMSEYVYQYNNNWYYSTDMLMFSKINFNANNTTPIGIDLDTVDIYLYNNMVLTGAPATQNLNGKEYYMFGIMRVNPTDLTDCCLYYNGMTYLQASPESSYAPGINFTRYIPTFLSSGTVFGSDNNTILYHPILGFVIGTSSSGPVVNKINSNGSIDPTNIYSLVSMSNIFYSSGSGYFLEEDNKNTNQHSIADVDFAYNFSTGWFTRKSDGSTQGAKFVFRGWSCKPIGNGKMQYVLWGNNNFVSIDDPDTRASRSTLNNFDKHATLQYCLNGGWSGSGNGYLYISFETTSYLNPDSAGYSWNGDTKQFVQGNISVSCSNLSYTGYINSACLEPFTFEVYSLAKVSNNWIPSINNQLIASPIPLEKPCQSLVFVGGAMNSTNQYNMFMCLASPRNRMFFVKNFESLANPLYVPSGGTSNGITSSNSDFCSNGNIINAQSNYPNWNAKY